jgi:hypothetical protein
MENNHWYCQVEDKVSSPYQPPSLSIRASTETDGSVYYRPNHTGPATRSVTLIHRRTYPIFLLPHASAVIVTRYNYDLLNLPRDTDIQQLRRAPGT